MPPQKTKSNLFARLGDKARKAHDQYAKETDTLGREDVPAGIEDGVAQLRSCKLVEIEKEDSEFKGELAFSAQAVVVLPKTIRTKDGVTKKAAGKQLQFFEYLCDTPKKSRKTFGEHYAQVLKWLRTLGVETDGVSYDDMPSVIENLSDEKPYFSFRTWIGEPTDQFPNPRVNVEWRGRIDDFDPNAIEDGVVDETETQTATNGDGGSDGEDRVTTATPDGDDLDTLGMAADNEDSDAQDRLRDLAREVGLEDDDVINAETYGALAALIREKQDGGGDTPAGEPEKEEPKKGRMTKYRPPQKGPGGKVTKAKKPIECEIVAVDKKNETVDLKNVADKKVYKAVPWSDLDE